MDVLARSADSAWGATWRWCARGLLWASLATVLLFLHGNVLAFFYGGEIHLFAPVMLIAFFYYFAGGLVVWTCVTRLNPVLARRYEHDVFPQLAFGLLAAFAAVVLLTIATYFYLFPYVMKRQVRPAGLFSIAMRSIMVALIVQGWLIMRSHINVQARRAAQLLHDTAVLETERDQSELAMLEAQIEPHFLFNTLAHIKRLYRVDAASADQVLHSLIGYLEQALPALRRANWTVGDEIALVELYLGILKQRFDERFDFVIELPEAQKSLAIPALTVATLVENAVRHGLGPKAGKGTVRVCVSQGVAGVQIAVCDDGVGLRATSGKGLGLATVRARLRSKFGTLAQLVVEPATVGVRSTIHLPSAGLHAS